MYNAPKAWAARPDASRWAAAFSRDTRSSTGRVVSEAATSNESVFAHPTLGAMSAAINSIRKVISILLYPVNLRIAHSSGPRSKCFRHVSE